MSTVFILQREVMEHINCHGRWMNGYELVSYAAKEVVNER